MTGANKKKEATVQIQLARVRYCDEILELKKAAAREGDRVSLKDAKDTTWFLARVDDEVAGCAGLLFMRNGFARLKSLYVMPEHRHLGVGTQLREVRVAEAEARGCAGVRTFARDPASYERMGFLRKGTRANGAGIMEMVF